MIRIIAEEPALSGMRGQMSRNLHTTAALYAISQSIDRISSQQHRKGHVLPDVGRYALQRAGG